MFAIPYPEPTDADQAVINGLALLEHNGISRVEVIATIVDDIEIFDITSCETCVAGLTVGWSERRNLWGYPIETEHADDLFGFDTTATPWDHFDLHNAWVDRLGIR